MRFYRALLRLYPASFRAEYRDELCYAFAERTRELSGPFASVRILLAALADVIPNAIAAHWDVLRQDLGYAARSLRRTPGFALTAVLVVALGVGANTAVFSLADFVFVRPLPYADADRLVKLWQGSGGSARTRSSPANYRDWKAMDDRRSPAWARTGVRAANLVGAGEPRRLETVRATPELLPLLGVAPLIGRVFTARGRRDRTVRRPELRALAVAVRRRPRRDRHVRPARRRAAHGDRRDAGVVPVPEPLRRSLDAARPARRGLRRTATTPTSKCVARLRPGVSVEQARQELAVVSARLEQQYPKENEDIGALVLGLRDELSERARLLRARALRRGALHPAPRLREPREPVSRARRPPRARAGRALRARRRRASGWCASSSPKAWGSPSSAASWGSRLPWRAMPLLARLVPSTLPIAEQRVAGSARARARRGLRAPHRLRVRPRSRDARGAEQRARRAAQRRAHRRADARSGCAPRSSSSRSRRRSCCSSRRGC